METTKYIRMLSTYRDVYANQEGAGYNIPSVAYNTTTGSSIHVNDPYVHNFTSSGSRDTTTLVLFILFVSFSICLLLMRLSCFFDPREESRGQHGDGNAHDPSTLVRTQESIESMIVLKKVLTVTDQDLDLESGKKSNKNVKRIDRKKSNLILHSHGGDELDESRTCPICLCEYEDGERICWSHNKQCAHHFHAQCGIAWLAKHTECPICRADYLVEPAGDDKNQETPSCTESCIQNPITIIEEDDDDSDTSNDVEAQQLQHSSEESLTEPDVHALPDNLVTIGTESLHTNTFETEQENVATDDRASPDTI